jgi:hypothetical protein
MTPETMTTTRTARVLTKTVIGTGCSPVRTTHTRDEVTTRPGRTSSETALMGIDRFMAVEVSTRMPIAMVFCAATRKATQTGRRISAVDPFTLSRYCSALDDDIDAARTIS